MDSSRAKQGLATAHGMEASVRVGPANACPGSFPDCLDPPVGGGFTVTCCEVLRRQRLRGSRGRRPETAKEDRVTRNISREELKEKMDRGEEFFLVDTLEEPYYRHSHLPGAINIPLEEIERAPEAIPDKGAEIVVYCMDPP